MLLKQVNEKLHCPLPVAVFVETECLLYLPHKRRLGRMACVLRLNGGCGVKKRRTEENYGKTIWTPGTTYHCSEPPTICKTRFQLRAATNKSQHSPDYIPTKLRTATTYRTLNTEIV